MQRKPKKLETGSVVESVRLPPRLPLKAGHVDRPTPGEIGDPMTVLGWALGENGPIESIEVVAGGEVIAKTSDRVTRPDIGRGFPDVSGAGDSGFRLEIAVHRFKLAEQFSVEAVAADGSRAPMWTICLRWDSSEPVEPPEGNGGAAAPPAPRRRWFQWRS